MLAVEQAEPLPVVSKALAYTVCAPSARDEVVKSMVDPVAVPEPSRLAAVQVEDE
jgi:hypothetical protein